jgi:hypothetical protein
MLIAIWNCALFNGDLTDVTTMTSFASLYATAGQRTEPQVMQLHSDGSLDGSQAEPKDEPFDSYHSAFDQETQFGPYKRTGT